MLRTSKVHYKSSELYPILHEHFGKSMNLARINALCMMVCALCKVQRIAYTKLASAFDNEAGADSSLRRIQRLIAECVINTVLIAKLKLIPVKGPYSLSLDRTNWKFSDTNINMLTWDVQAEMADWDDVQRAQEQRLQHWRLSRQNPRTHGQSICYRNACICLVLPRWYLYSRKHQEDKGSASWQKSQMPLQIRTGVYRTVPPEPHEPLSNRYFQFFCHILRF